MQVEWRCEEDKARIVAEILTSSSGPDGVMSPQQLLAGAGKYAKHKLCFLRGLRFVPAVMGRSSSARLVAASPEHRSARLSLIMIEKINTTAKFLIERVRIRFQRCRPLRKKLASLRLPATVITTHGQRVLSSPLLALLQPARTSRWSP